MDKDEREQIRDVLNAMKCPFEHASWMVVQLRRCLYALDAQDKEIERLQNNVKQLANQMMDMMEDTNE